MRLMIFQLFFYTFQFGPYFSFLWALFVALSLTIVSTFGCVGTYIPGWFSCHCMSILKSRGFPGGSDDIKIYLSIFMLVDIQIVSSQLELPPLGCDFSKYRSKCPLKMPAEWWNRCILEYVYPPMWSPTHLKMDLPYQLIEWDSFVFCFLPNMIGVGWRLSIVWINSSLIANEAKYLSLHFGFQVSSDEVSVIFFAHQPIEWAYWALFMCISRNRFFKMIIYL